MWLLYVFGDFGSFAGTGNQVGWNGFKEENTGDLCTSEFQVSHKLEVKIYWFSPVLKIGNKIDS